MNLLVKLEMIFKVLIVKTIIKILLFLEGMQTLTIDENLPILDRFKKYIRSEIVLLRLYLIKSLTEYITQLNFLDSINELLPLIEEYILHDPEASVRQALVEQIPFIAQYFIQKIHPHFNVDLEPTPYTTVLHILIPIVTQLTTDGNQQVLMN